MVFYVSVLRTKMKKSSCVCLFKCFNCVALHKKTHCKGSASSKSKACWSPDEIEDRVNTSTFFLSKGAGSNGVSRFVSGVLLKSTPPHMNRLILLLKLRYTQLTTWPFPAYTLRTNSKLDPTRAKNFLVFNEAYSLWLGVLIEFLDIVYYI